MQRLNLAAAHLRRNREGMLLADSLAHAVRFVIDGASGRIVFPADGTILGAEELVLFVPREDPTDDHELQLLLSVGPAEESLKDRWRAYHGAPAINTFGAFAIEDAKFDGEVVDGEISPSNPLAGIETRLCKRLSADGPALGAACKRDAGVAVVEPVAVGVDAFGVDVRARFGIVRLEFEAPVMHVAEAERAIDRLLRGGA